MAILKIKDESGNICSIPSIKGDKGDPGNSGVYVGSGKMPEGYNIQIDPNGYVDINEQEISDIYFDIDYDGLVSLKPEYRGDSESAEECPYSISDLGAGKEGSKILDLPEVLVIPGNVDKEQVRGFHPGIFRHNYRIKKLVLPLGVKKLPEYFVAECIYLEEIENLEQIEYLDKAALAQNRIKEAYLPNLKNMENAAFMYCGKLARINIGNNIEIIKEKTFYGCSDLIDVIGGDKVKTIESYAFYSTRRLRDLPLLKNVTSIGECAFAGSNVDFEEVYPILVTNNCTFGTYATYKQFNDVDYWTGVSFEPCKNPLNSLFHQKDIRWADKQIGNYTYKDENGNSTGVPYTYANNGCALCTLIAIYSAFTGTKFESPEEMVELMESKGLTKYDFRYRDDWCSIVEGLGLTVVKKYDMLTKDSLQHCYQELKNGALLYSSIGVPKHDMHGGHATLVYGINSDGEVLTSESSIHTNRIGIYENFKDSCYIYQRGSKECDMVIVKYTPKNS